MRKIVAKHLAPRWPWRLAAIFGIWFTIFGIVIAFTPDSDPSFDPFVDFLEMIKATLVFTITFPMTGLIGFATFVGGARGSWFIAVVSLLAIIGLPAIIFFRCSSRLSFRYLIGLHTIVATVASIGFLEAIKSACETP